MLYMLVDGLLTWTAHSEHQEVWASWSSSALNVRSLLLPAGFQDPSKSALLQPLYKLQ
jgi:hypothetical protein